MVSQISFVDVGAQPLSRVSFDSQAGGFSLLAGANGEYVCHLPYDFQSFDGAFLEDGLVELFIHSSHAESDVRSIKLAHDENTVGWLCTIGALTSNQHEYVDSPHFRRAAFVAVNLLLTNGCYTKSPSLNHGSEIRISDLFDEELSILILHKPSVAHRVSQTCAELLPNLHQYGFIPFNAQFQLPIEAGKFAADMLAQSRKSMRLFPISRDVRFEDFVNQVFRQLLPSAITPLLRFFIYYQLIETLLARIFNDRQSETIMMMVPVKDNPVKVHPLIKKLQEDATEKKRMNLLFNNYSNVATKMGDLLVASNEFLKECGAEEKMSVAEALYEVRNVVFHDLRGIPELAMLRLGEIVEQMSFAVPELLIGFRIPDAVPEAV